MKDNEAMLVKENFKLRNEVTSLKEGLKNTGTALSFAKNKIRQLEKQLDDYKKDEEIRIQKIVEKAVKQVTKELNDVHEKEVHELKAKINRLEKRLNTNSSNSGIPTSKDRIEIHKVQNNREKSNKNKGGQKDHPIHKLEYFKEEEITNTVEHTLEKCPKCGGDLEEINVVKSDIIDIEVKVTKTRNNIHNYKCSHCKKMVSANDELPRGVTYGENINATILAMMNEANTPLNKIESIISGITNNEVVPTEGYFVKLQKRSAKKLEKFTRDLKEKVISLSKLFWDDTTVKFGIGKPEEGYDSKDLEYLEKIANDEKKKDKKVRTGVIRFYGDDRWALLVGHRSKSSKGIDEDGILDNLPETCTVMHDHVLLNYNDKYRFQNAECNEHARRYLKGNMDTFPQHAWAKQMRDFLKEIKDEKENMMKSKITSFTNERLTEIFTKYDEIIRLGYKENESVGLEFILNKNDELNLIERLDNFKENHLKFATDFSVSFTNNTSEKGIRQVKRKIAVSFMFNNANRMKDYAIVLSYLETCYRNGISRFEASKRLIANNPYTIDELANLKENENV